MDEYGVIFDFVECGKMDILLDIDDGYGDM